MHVHSAIGPVQGRVMIVEDEEQVRKPIRLNLTKAGYEVIEVTDGAQAISILEEDDTASIDTVLCDIRMPKVNGLEAIRHFRTHFATVPVVVLTGYPDVELAATLMKQGVLDYMIKPVTREELLTVVERCVGQHAVLRSEAVA
jgi:two-component system chemotaxis response regulator CheY